LARSDPKRYASTTNSVLTILAVVLWTVTASAAAQAGEATMPVRMETLELGKLASGRTSTISVWFPQGKCADGREKQLCLADGAVTDRVMIFSHGAMGSAAEYAWIGEKLAAAGFVVVGINHFGESPVYGQDSVNPRSATLIWQRPQDISALLDKLASHDIFQRTLRWSNVVAIGHSEGGQTAAMLAGATFDLQRLVDYCDSAHSKGDLSCNYGRNRASAPEEFRQQFSASQQDARVRMIVMLDPALGSAVQAQSLLNIEIPTLVMGATNNDFIPWSQHGLRYATEIPNARTCLLTGQEGHFVFLDACHHQVRVMGIALCDDRPGVDRKATHDAIANTLIEFVRAHDAVVATQKTAAMPARQYSTSSTLTDILIYTPRWVFGLLAALVIFGLLQTRTRQVRMPVALILPIAMLLLSLTGVLRYVGWRWSALSCWLVGLASVAGLSVALMDKSMGSFDLSSRKLQIQGSWWPLIVILGIFFTRYALGVATAMQLNIIHQAYFQETISIVLGGWSGFFLARGVVFGRAKALVRGPSTAEPPRFS
jgi:predicted dienelactone hydrolase